MKKCGFSVQFVGLCAVLFLMACSGQKAFTKKDIRHAQKLIGVEFSRAYIKTSHNYLLRNRSSFDSLRKYPIDIEVMPALEFNPHPKFYQVPMATSLTHQNWIMQDDFSMPSNREEISFYTIPKLAFLLRTQQITSSELTALYLSRIKKYDPQLKCVITLLEEEAMMQAKKVDEEMAQGVDKGILHGIPYGVKDLMAVEGHPTTWGAEPYRDQMIDYTATVVNKLNDAGAILIAKLTSGALARGDVWFGGKTKNPWDTEQGASGSSAGSGSATAAGLVGFSLGTETLGSITSPSTRNGVTGLRTTYGTVSRHGVMSLSWSMDKVGPICRSAEDCAIVYDYIRGPAREDQTIGTHPFDGIQKVDLSTIKIGVLSELVEKDTTESGDHLRENIELLKSIGCQLIPTKLPEQFPTNVYDIILRAEAGAFFDELVLSGRVDQMVEQSSRSRANSLRQSRFIPAVEYIQANRSRRMLIEAMHELMKEFDVIVTPTFGGPQLMFTNLTGHPVVCVPTGLDEKGHPTSMSFLGNLYDESIILSVAHAFQKATDFHKKNPPGFLE